MKLSDGGTVNLLSRSYGVYNFNELGLQKCTTSLVDESESSETTYQCASHEMRVFGAIGSGASSVVQRAIHIPKHRLLALKRINIFERVNCKALSFLILLRMLIDSVELGRRKDSNCLQRYGRCVKLLVMKDLWTFMERFIVLTLDRSA